MTTIKMKKIYIWSNPFRIRQSTTGPWFLRMEKQKSELHNHPNLPKTPFWTNAQNLYPSRLWGSYWADMPQIRARKGDKTRINSRILHWNWGINVNSEIHVDVNMCIMYMYVCFSQHCFLKSLENSNTSTAVSRTRAQVRTIFLWGTGNLQEMTDFKAASGKVQM